MVAMALHELHFALQLCQLVQAWEGIERTGLPRYGELLKIG